uniref:Proline-rich receptor-like protein kinase PERK10 n=1 Tax=Elaeis guineensis var. tenera TaxID=51953 RepID=A0A6J0PER4_ELAGV
PVPPRPKPPPVAPPVVPAPPRPQPPPVAPPVVPAPPRPLPPPTPVTPPSPPSPTPNTVIIIVFVSLGGLLFLAFLAAALFCFLKKKKKKKMVQENDVVNVEDRVRVHETIVSGPHGPQVLALAVDEDIRVQEVMKKNEFACEASGTKLGVEAAGTNKGGVAVPPGSKRHHLLEHKG